MAIKKDDFIEIEYTGKIKEGSIIFDTTSEKIAKDNGVFDAKTDYGPVVICVGHGHVLKGIDDALVGKEPGREYHIDLKPEDAFGNKEAKLIQLVSTGKFRQQKIQPMPGLQVNIDGIFGIIKTVTGGRTLVDFNHPLAGKEVAYDLKINRGVADDKEKVKACLKLMLGIKDCNVSIENGNARVEIKAQLTKEIQEKANEEITKMVPSLKKIELLLKKEEKNK